jgi:lipopolysaccharide cholinephosphotransferase
MKREKRALSSEECKKMEISILQVIIEICECHNLRYIVDYGSLIGIVRHGGFIPWDDDIDISMPRPDYEIFRQIFDRENKKNPELELRTGMKGNLALPYIQVVNTHTFTEKKGRRKAFSQAVWVDVFPVDGAGETEEQKAEVYEKYWAQIQASRAVIGRYQPYLNPLKQVRQFYRHYIKRLTLKQTIEKAERILQTYDYDASNQVFCFCTVYGVKEQNQKSFYEDRIEMEFEGIRCKIPREYDKKLRGIYGDYMTFPPESERRGHDYTAWWKES